MKPTIFLQRNGEQWILLEEHEKIIDHIREGERKACGTRAATWHEDSYEAGFMDALDALIDGLPLPTYDGEWRIKFRDVYDVVEALRDNS